MESMETEKVKRRINFDDILLKELGEFGLFQFRTLLLILISVIFGAWAASEYVFTTARIRTRCLIPECDGAEPEFSPPWILYAVPASGDSFASCERFRSAGNFTHQPSCPAHMFDVNHRDACEEQVYENTLSVVYDFDLGCDEWRRSMIGSLRTLGSLGALPITGFISDRFGRRMALAFNSFNLAWLGAIRYVASSYNGFVISQLVEAMFGFGAFSCAYVIATEIVGPKYRVAAGATISTFFSVGQVLMGLIAWAVPDWKTLTLTLYVPQIITIGYLWLISESVRWYLSKECSSMGQTSFRIVCGPRLAVRSFRLPHARDPGNRPARHPGASCGNWHLQE